MELVDTHCHLSFAPLADDIDGVLARAKERGVTRILVPAYDLSSWADIEQLSLKAGIFPALGLHPWVADQPLDGKDLRKRLLRCQAVAVGEIGLDFKIDTVPRETQLERFSQQLDIAADLDLPVLLHCRGAFEEMLETLALHPDVRGVLHAFSRGPELASRFLDTGLHLAFGGAVTRPWAKRPRRSAAKVPLEKILLETDAPSIGLDGVEPAEVEPVHVHDIANALAELRGTTLDEIAKETTTNARELFELP